MNITDTTPVNPALAITKIDPDGLRGLTVDPFRMMQLVEEVDQKRLELHESGKTGFDAGGIAQIVSYLCRTPDEFATMLLMTGERFGIDSDSTPKKDMPSIQELRERRDIMKETLEFGKEIQAMLNRLKEEGGKL